MAVRELLRPQGSRARGARKTDVAAVSMCFRGGSGPAFGAELGRAPHGVERNVRRSRRSAGPRSVSRVRRPRDEAQRSPMAPRGRFRRAVIARRLGAPARGRRPGAAHGDGRYRLRGRGKRSMKQAVALHRGIARSPRTVPLRDCPANGSRHETGHLTGDNTSYRASTGLRQTRPTPPGFRRN